jgi:hypothetical protein
MMLKMKMKKSVLPLKLLLINLKGNRKGGKQLRTRRRKERRIRKGQLLIQSLLLKVNTS